MKNPRTNPIRIAVALIAGLMAIAPSHAAVAPLSAKELKERSTHIVTGTVLDVSRKSLKAKMEDGDGFNRDRVYLIRLKVDTVTKTSPAKPDAKPDAKESGAPDKKPDGKKGTDGDSKVETQIKPGDEIVIQAWKPARRIRYVAGPQGHAIPDGLQGHETVPGKGITITTYLLEKENNTYAPLLPNGIQQQPKAKVDKEKPKTKK